MPKALDVPWDKIREACEKGATLRDAAKLFDISEAAIRMRSHRESWNTPQRKLNKLNKKAREQNIRVAQGASLTDQLNESEAGKNLAITSTDLEALSKEYRNKAADKLYKILTQTVIAPPRTWKDFDIADKMMRRTLGLDDGESKSNTVVQLQVVNDRLRTTLADDIVEGEYVTEVSPKEDSLCETTGCQSVSELEGDHPASIEAHSPPFPAES